MTGFVALFTQAELERFVGADTVRRILDDDRDGTADENAVTDIIADASAHVLSAYYQTYDEVPDEEAIPARLKTLGKHAGKAYLAIRHPEYVRFDGYTILGYVDKQLDALVAGNRRIGETPPDVAANQGGETYSGDPELPNCYEVVFQGSGGSVVF
jgi:hypothetical protein